jgi:tRNA(Ile)-lysidine synthase
VVAEDKSHRRGRPSLVRKAGESARRERLFPTGSKALVMVSGGQDSLTLLHLLATGGLGSAGPASVHALHVNYHLRGAESDADESLVVKACDLLGVGLTVVHCPVDKSEGNVQEVAREARRAAALDVAEQTGCERIAMGHTADDQVETLLYRMGRYGGVAAMAGMRPCDPPWVRPLLDCRREETAAYCSDNALEFASDRGNAYPGYARTGIRESVLPAWEAALPGAVAAACRTAEVAAEMKELAGMVLAQTAATARVSGRQGDADPALSAAALLSLPGPVRRLLLYDWLDARATAGASRASVLAVESLLSVAGSAQRALGGGLRACKEYDLVYLEPVGAEPLVVPAPVALSVPGVAEWGGSTVVAEPVQGFWAVNVAREAIIDADGIAGSLQLRGPLPGDRLQPLGAPGSRRLKEILIDLRVPARERARRPLVVCGESIVWVCGLVVADEVKVTRDTTRFLRLSITRDGEGAAACAR